MDKSFKRLILEVLGAAVRQFNGGWRELSRSGLVNFLDQLLARCSDVKAEDDCLPVVNVLKDCVVTTINQQINIPHELESDSSDDESDEASSCASDSSSNNTSDSGSDSDSDDEEDIVHQMEIEQSTEKAVKEKSMWISFSAQLIQLLERLSASHGATSSSDIKEISTVLLSAMKSTDGRTLELIDRLQQLIHN
jgi:hypothetical protein